MMFLLKGDLGFQGFGSCCTELRQGSDQILGGVIVILMELMIQKIQCHLTSLRLDR